MDTNEQKRKTTKVGTVVGKKIKKTVTVEVERQIRHPLYKKNVRKKKTFLVHDETEWLRVSDMVRTAAVITEMARLRGAGAA